MREILFRGKRLDNGEWVYGGYGESLYPSHACIVQTHNGGAVLSGYECVEVIASTVGQYTGLMDMNGKRIFEGDILKKLCPVFKLGQRSPAGYRMVVGSVEWSENESEPGHWVLKTRDELGNSAAIIFCDDFRVVGNVFDDPELLKGGQGNG